MVTPVETSRCVLLVIFITLKAKTAFFSNFSHFVYFLLIYIYVSVIFLKYNNTVIYV